MSAPVLTFTDRGRLLPSGRCLYRPLEAGGPRRHHPRSRRSRASRHGALPGHRRPRCRSCGTGWARSTLQTHGLRRSHRDGAAQNSFIRRVTCRGRLRCGSRWVARSGWSRAITSWRRTEFHAPFEPVALPQFHHRMHLRDAGVSLEGSRPGHGRDQPLVGVEQGPAGRFTLMGAYSLGKAQRVLAGLDTSIGPILTHGAVEATNKVLRAQGSPCPRRCR